MVAKKSASKPLRGKDLNDAIEVELKFMLDEGFESSPISKKAVHARITKKGYISSGLSVLSHKDRTDLIDHYINKQLDASCDDADINESFKAGRTVEGYKAARDKLKKENDVLKERLRINTEALVKIVHQIQMTNISVDNVLPEHLVAQLDESVPDYNSEFTPKFVQDEEW
ncbi:hypothetical protein C9J48_11005 [Photobacterium profundum]|uniref:Uncharacterized protein n=1 Tax=Photobacterium profundum 3TCK TaxID=314280 RepID=Q1YWW5_9GAMM|nr:hypothetical protein [Photobacterium profundum]EAS40737.1 hypothetical protein P3TCK_08623 [Photobacterium profundum 3TCK]PSV62482.1 hypothetical protein C9J48_11005 [Photobacterium profundum]